MLKVNSLTLLHTSMAFLMIYFITSSALISAGVALIGLTMISVAFYFDEKMEKQFEISEMFSIIQAVYAERT